ncbi:hypothetical protein D3C85_1658490 [compost metagenome]
MERIDLEPHDVHGLAGPGDRNLHAGHVAHAQRLGGVPRLALAAHLVMVRQRPEGHAAGMGARGHVTWREHPVGHGGMAVQIGVDCVRVLHGDHSTPGRVF